jgi:trk system potassium uptake protein
MSQFVVIGLGNFGFSAAITLANKRQEVLAIDTDPQKVNKIKDYVTEAVVADVRNKEILKELVSKDVDAVIIGLGDTLEASTLATLHLKELGIHNIIVKVVDETHGTILRKIGATEIINPEKESGARIAERLITPNMLDQIPLDPDYSIIEIAVPDKFAGRTLSELKLRTKYNIEIIAVKDILMDKFYIIPESNYKLSPDNILIAIGKQSDLKNLKFL